MEEDPIQPGRVGCGNIQAGQKTEKMLLVKTTASATAHAAAHPHSTMPEQGSQPPSPLACLLFASASDSY